MPGFVMLLPVLVVRVDADLRGLGRRLSLAIGREAELAEAPRVRGGLVVGHDRDAEFLLGGGALPLLRADPRAGLAVHVADVLPVRQLDLATGIREDDALPVLDRARRVADRQRLAPDAPDANE